MSRHGRDSYELVHFVSTGRLARPLDDYDPLTAEALLACAREVLAGGDEVDPDAPMETGDPVVDAWERAWARGENPLAE